MSKHRKIGARIGWIITALLCIQSVAPSAALSVSFSLGFGLGGGTSYSSDPYYNEMNWSAPTADAGSILNQTNQGGSIIDRLLTTFGINYAGNGKALSYVQIIINYILAFVAFIALIVILYGFYMMFFRDQDKGFGEAKKTVLGAGAALFIIGISRLFVNFAFYIFERGF